MRIDSTMTTSQIHDAIRNGHLSVQRGAAILTMRQWRVERRRRIAMFVVEMLCLAGIIAIGGASGGCSRPAPLPTIPVSIVAWPSPIRPACTLPDPPPLPALTMYQTESGTALERVYVTAREWTDLRQWLADMGHVWSSHRACLQKLTGNP